MKVVEAVTETEPVRVAPGAGLVMQRVTPYKPEEGPLVLHLLEAACTSERNKGLATAAQRSIARNTIIFSAMVSGWWCDVNTVTYWESSSGQHTLILHLIFSQPLRTIHKEFPYDIRVKDPICR